MHGLFYAITYLIHLHLDSVGGEKKRSIIWIKSLTKHRSNTSTKISTQKAASIHHIHKKHLNIWLLHRLISKQKTQDLIFQVLICFPLNCTPGMRSTHLILARGGIVKEFSTTDDDIFRAQPNTPDSRYGNQLTWGRTA